MNTPRQKKRHKITFTPASVPGGQYVGCLTNEEHAKRFAAILSTFEHLESYMPRVLARLTGIQDITAMSPAGYIYRVLRNPSIKSEVMRTLLEAAPGNISADEKFDEILLAYETVRTKRNQYAHGLWWTNTQDGSVYLAISDQHGLGFMQAQPVTLEELDITLEQIGKLTIRVLTEI